MSSKPVTLDVSRRVALNTLWQAVATGSLLTACGGGSEAVANSPAPGVGAPTATTFASGLENPWGLAFLPDGRMLVTEKAGRLRIVSSAVAAGPHVTVSGVPAVLNAGQGGLLH